MSLTTQTLILTIGMAVFCALPLLFPVVQRQRKLLFLIGTGAMLGLCVFDLLPDVFALGGRPGIVVTAAVGIIYSLIHFFYIGLHHTHEHGGEEANHEHGFWTFLLSLMGHCFASGMLLAVSMRFSQKIAMTVFLALIAHKGYESLTFTSILMAKKKSRRENSGIILIYVSALPLGVWVTRIFGASANQTLAMYVSACAVGSLLGCLVFDFILPSFHHVKEERYQIAWLLAGLLLTQLLMRQI